MTFEDSWAVVKQAADENKHELLLTGESVSKLIEKSGLDGNLFNLHNLNYLSITQTCLREVPDGIAKLTNLTTLVLHSNDIVTITDKIGELAKLKVLDCSRNNLKSLPQALNNLPQLTTLNLASNSLQSVPSQIGNVKLSILNLSDNRFEIFPDVCYTELVHLSEIHVNKNQIKTIPSTVCYLQALKVFNVADNAISVVPGELADCGKLKEVNLKGNKLADKRLLKLVNQCHSKQVLDYVRQHCPRSELSNTEANKSKKGRKTSKSSESEITMDGLAYRVKVLRMTDDTPVIETTEHVKKVRPYIAACIVKNMKFTDESFKKFIQLQTKLHDGICEKRNAATIATHDFKLIAPGNLTYTAKLPTELKIKPLMRSKMYTGATLFKQLQTEAENLRKEKKRNVYSGVHKYLYLLEGKSVYPCLLDHSEQVISFPPITNSDVTKMSPSTTTMFVEVTSATSYTVCRSVMDEFLKELAISGLADSSDEKDAHKCNLFVEQVKVVDTEGNLKLLYPSRADLKLENFSVSVLRE